MGAREVAVGGGEKPLDARFCEDLLNDVVRRDPIRFEPGRPEPKPADGPALAGVADVLRRCGQARIGVVSTTSAAGDLDEMRDLSLKRAAAIVRSLKALGTGADLQPVGRAAVASDPAKAGPDQLTFEVRP